MNRHVLYLALGILLFTLLFRTFVSGWSPLVGATALSPMAYGISYNPIDALSYISWAQQSANGLWRFGDLYTTTDHGRLLFNPLFLLVGKVSSLFSGSPILVLNVLALFAVPLFIFSIAKMFDTLGLSKISTFVAVCLALGGGGVSWIRLLAVKFGLNHALMVGDPGPDLYYLDLYPAVTFFAYPYHAISLAVVSFLTFMVVRHDNEKLRFSLKSACVITCSAIVPASIRPYESVMIIAVYAFVVAASYVFRLPKAIRHRRTIILVCLVAGMLPLIFYSFWVSQHAVWNHFAKLSLYIQRGDWSAGFFLLWILAGVGIGVLGSRLLLSSYAFPVFWSFGCGALLIIFNSGYTKLCGGCTIPLAILSGLTVEKYKDRFSSKRYFILILWLLVFLSFASSAWAIYRMTHPERRVRLPAELFQVIEKVRRDTRNPSPCVLTDLNTGSVLPGLGGFRVFCGHWSLSDDYEQKASLLTRLGFGSDNEERLNSRKPENVDSNAVRLLSQVQAGTFQYVLVRSDHWLHQDLANTEADCTVHSGNLFLVVRMCPTVKAKIEKKLRSIGSKATPDGMHGAQAGMVYP